jgi:dolichyl-phosphate beta-glucosyltransferase
LRRSVSIIIPAYNEENRLPATLGRIAKYLSSGIWEASEILVVDDGSRDATPQIAEAAGARVLANRHNRGKGYSVRHGMLNAKSDWALLTDADLSAPIEELDKLWSAAEREGAAVAIGSRALDRSLIGVRQPAFRDFSGRFFNLTMRALTGLPYHDTQCGFKLFRADAAREIFSRQRLEGFGFDVEVLYIAHHLDYKCVEIPVRWSDVAGTKVSLWRGLGAFGDLFQVRWNGLTRKYGSLAPATTRPVRSV